MKIVILIITLLSVQAFANPFDGFVGKYAIDGKVQIKNLNAKGCIRHGIPQMTGIEVKQDTKGYKQSHVVYILTASGWSGLPVMQYEDRPDYLNPSVVYVSKVQGNANYAELVQGSNAQQYFADRFSFERKAGQIIFNFSEEYIKEGQLQAACYYQATLK